MMNKLLEKATNYAQQHFSISEEGIGDVIRNDVAFHSFIAGYNSACKEFKEYLEKKYNEASNSYDKTEAEAYEDKMDYIKEIINELFGEE